MGQSTDEKRVQAAFLATRNMKEEGIAALLGASRYDVSRWLRDYKRDGILRDCTVLDRTRLDKDQIRVLEAFEEGAELLGRIHEATPKGLPHVRRIRVYGSGRKANSIRGLDISNRTFGRQIATDVRDLILQCRHCMVAWGRLLGGVVEEIRATFPTGLARRKVEFYPACGDPIGAFNANTTPSALCAELDRVFNRSLRSHKYSLAGVPAVIPGDLRSDEERQVLKSYVERSDAYRAIFGEGDARKDIDCIITGVGGAESAAVGEENGFGLYTQECLKTLGVKRPWLSEHVLGDIAGVYIEKPDLKDKERKALAEKRELWLGVKLEDFQRCASKARVEETPGVVVAAVGEKTLAEVIFACCTRLGIITELFIDPEMVEHLTAICNRVMPKRKDATGRLA